ncbi:DmsE family decaheme c-type cytochrome [Rhodanobacter sp. MP7CTX1]|uniref:DmsE family decaheme c-type cytochrome n=1 Tax=Rhodanobacter sp. MP7CTX1 TaxID=2723084 RepID=UPI00180F5430|nr:DmsE family decaheme c-type cytochrome [Rhodanobacter sp. MP7CTX1]MBB6186029.1 DmsE family decaheme c-type cytochrome [Rhodanobacter sp. MP7CTX1]
MGIGWMAATRKRILDRNRARRATGVIALSLMVLLAVMTTLGGVLLWSSSVHAQQSDSANAGQPPTHQPSAPLTESDIARMLPPTDMDAGTSVHSDMRTSAFDEGHATPFDGASIPQNPLAPNADPIGAKSCVACHTLEDTQASHSLHVASFRASGSASAGPQGSCETCHGPGSEHAKNAAAPGLIIAFTHDSKTPAETQTHVCLSCHVGGARQHWLGSVHQERGVLCTDCHNPMARLSAEGVLANESINQVCATCHQDIRAQFNRRSHMPLPEGQISCVDCHNPHGSITKPLLKTDSVNETCQTCHAEKRGPFLFEHAPVAENCLNCHTPHGSNQENLLVLPMPMLCQQCHTNNNHPNDLLTRQNLRNGLAPDERVMGRSCLTCHSNIHGSNNPNGAMFHQ